MATIEINENTVVRSLVRKGTNAERKNITLAQGELGFVTDLGPNTILDDGGMSANPGRLFVGNNNSGGFVAGNKYLGSTSDDNVSSFNALPGDLIFKTDTSTLYARKLTSTAADSLEDDFESLSSGIIIGKGLTTSGGATIVDLAGDPTVATNPLVWDGNSITVGEISLSTIADIDEYTILANATITSGPPTATIVGENSVLGRTGSEVLQTVSYDKILSNAQDPTVSGLTVTGLADAAGVGPVQVNASGTLSRVSTTGGTTFTQWSYYDRPYQIFGATNYTGSTSVGSLGSTINTNGTQIDINPWTLSGLPMPSGVKAAIVYGTLDTTVQPTGGNTRALGPNAWQAKQGLTVFSTLGTTATNYQMIFTGGAGEEDKGQRELASGSGQIPAILNSDGEFKLGCYGWQDHPMQLSMGVNWYIKLYLVGYAL